MRGFRPTRSPSQPRASIGIPARWTLFMQTIF